MRSSLNGGVNFQLFQSGRPGGKQTIGSRDGPAPKRKCSTRSKVGIIFTSVTNASLIREVFPDYKGIVVSKTEPIAKNLFDMLQDKIISDIEWEPTIVELLNP